MTPELIFLEVFMMIAGFMLGDWADSHTSCGSPWYDWSVYVAVFLLCSGSLCLVVTVIATVCKALS